MRVQTLRKATEGRRRYGSFQNDSQILPSENATEEAQDYISKAIKKHIDEGMPEDQAQAVSYKEAREKGYKVPKNDNSAYPTCAKCGHDYDKHHGGGISTSCQGAGCTCDGYRMTNQNGKCPICGDEMGMHDEEGRCDECGEQCG